MNNFAVELYKQASEYAYNKIGVEHADKSYFKGVVIGRFAELLLTECIDTINGVPNGYSDYRNQIEDSMREACVDAVKQKFGIE